MLERPSRTAMGNAILRAQHCRYDPPPWILEDPLAGELVPPDIAAELAAPLVGVAPDVVAAWRLASVVRPRVAEDVALDRLAAGHPNYVILGAGLDTFAWRHPRAGEFSLWELDHPLTQAWKRDAIAAAGLNEPSNVRFVAIDLANTPLARIELPRRATWSWLGVTVYLERSANEAVLEAIAGFGGTVVCSFVLHEDDCDAFGRIDRAAANRAVAAVGEPAVTTYYRSEIEALLRSAGFEEIEMMDASALAKRYLGARGDRRLPAATLIAVATGADQ
jgi:methyltransferase (TIGR00027 family)